MIRALQPYQCIKKVRAAKMKDCRVTGDGGVLITFEDDTTERRESDAAGPFLKAKAGWYYIQYDDGYASASPPHAFEPGYVPVKECHLVHSMDAWAWARGLLDAQVLSENSDADEITLTGWFANAIMAGYDEAMQRAKTVFSDSRIEVITDQQVLVINGQKWSLQALQMLAEAKGESYTVEARNGTLYFTKAAPKPEGY